VRKRVSRNWQLGSKLFQILIFGLAVAESLVLTARTTRAHTQAGWKTVWSPVAMNGLVETNKQLQLTQDRMLKYFQLTGVGCFL